MMSIKRETKEKLIINRKFEKTSLEDLPFRLKLIFRSWLPDHRKEKKEVLDDASWSVNPSIHRTTNGRN